MISDKTALGRFMIGEIGDCWGLQWLIEKTIALPDPVAEEVDLQIGKTIRVRLGNYLATMLVESFRIDVHQDAHPYDWRGMTQFVCGSNFVEANVRLVSVGENSLVYD